MAVSIR